MATNGTGRVTNPFPSPPSSLLAPQQRQVSLNEHNHPTTAATLRLKPARPLRSRRGSASAVVHGAAANRRARIRQVQAGQLSQSTTSNNSTDSHHPTTIASTTNNVPLHAQVPSSHHSPLTRVNNVRKRLPPSQQNTPRLPPSGNNSALNRKRVNHSAQLATFISPFDRSKRDRSMSSRLRAVSDLTRIVKVRGVCKYSLKSLLIVN